jgi:hypothetical protein
MRRSPKVQGSKPQSVIEKEVAQQITDAGVGAYYHGWDTICNLCTGDVSNILELLNRMFEECAVKKNTMKIVPADHQDSVIEGYARQYIAKIKGIPGYGERLFLIVDAFGHMARRLLEEYPAVMHGEGREEPYRLLRIELDEAYREVVDSAYGSVANGDASELWKLLQRYCIFIDADEGRSRRNTLSSRVLLRRIFCPAFRIGLVNSECFTLSQQEWQAFAADPAGRAEHYVRTNIEKAQRRRGSELSDNQKKFEFSEEREERQ